MQTKWPNDLESQDQWPPFSMPALNIPGCMFGANLVISAQICDGSSCRQSNVDGQTEKRMQAMMIPLRPERPRGKNEGTKASIEIWHMTLKKNRAPFICYFKLCASCCSHWWIQTGVTVRKFPIWVKIDNFFSRVTLKFEEWPWKTIGHPSKQYQALCIISLSYVTLTFDLLPWPYAGTSFLSLV